MVGACVRIQIQYSKTSDTSLFLNKKGLQRIQSTIGSCLYYGRVMDGTLLTTLNDIGLQQAKPKENTKLEGN